MELKQGGREDDLLYLEFRKRVEAEKNRIRRKDSNSDNDDDDAKEVVVKFWSLKYILSVL